MSVAVALADKIDALVGFWSIGEKPTGSKDRFALRRASLGVIRLILENGIRLPLLQVFDQAWRLHAAGGDSSATINDLLGFFADRLKVHLRERGVRHDLVTAVFALGGEDDLVRLLARVDALEKFIDSDAGADLLVAYRRAANIVRIEEKKDKVSYADGNVDNARFDREEEKHLSAKLAEASTASGAAIACERFIDAMDALAALRTPVDRFFDRVTVNCDDPGLRENRLRLLSLIGSTLSQGADFSKIEG